MPFLRISIIASCLFFLFSCRNKNTLFTALPASQTGVSFINELLTKDRFSILYYLYYYNGAGVSTGDINNDGLPDLYFTANSNGNNKLYLNKGNFTFEDITASAGVAGNADWCTGTTLADVNGDGYLDIYVCVISNFRGLKGHNLLYINNGNNTFTEKSAQYGLDFQSFSTQVAFFDYDHDGDLDCFLLNQSLYPNQNIVDTSHRKEKALYTGNYLYRNDLATGGKFTDVSDASHLYQSSLSYGLGLSVADMNNDGWDDIYVGNDFHENDYYYVNNGNGTFTEQGAEHFSHYSRFSMGNDIADYNNDGQPDVITVDMLPDNEKILKTYGSDENADIYNLKLIQNGFQYQYSKNCLQRNNGDGTSFSEVGLQAGVAATDWSWCPLFADFNNDGNKDLFISSGIVKRPVDLDYVRYVSDLYSRKAVDQSDEYDDSALNRMPDGSSHPYLYQGDGTLHFTDVSNEWGTGEMKGYFNGASYADLDNDGNLDIVINCLNAPAVILKNKAPQKNHLTLSFKGINGNTNGIGCKAYVFTRSKVQYAELMLTRGFQSSCEERVHFGLDTATKADSILVVWPNQKYEVIKNVEANRSLIFDQKNAKDSFRYTTFFPPKPPLFTQVTNISVPWQHHENAFDDYNIQYLIPHAESTRGPKLAVADINGDGLDDMFACGASGQSGALLMQQSNGSFAAIDTAVFGKDALCEDVDALFFDANGDGKTDLFVVSGGNEFTGNNPALADRLYLNDGSNHFTKTTGAVPLLYQNKSCVAAADVDGDGDTDLFIGTLADAAAYGIPQTSHLLLNDGHAHFSEAPESRILLTGIGMVTSALFSDVNKDNRPDLIVAGEWMPVTVFLNTPNGFEKRELPHSSGWWQTVYVDDVNSDGNPDILCGNWGWNNKFCSNKDGIVRLYVHDFSGNGRVNQLMSYSIRGEEYPFLAKDELEKPLPKLKKHYLLYSEYAGLPMKDVFYGWIDTIKPYVAERLGSAVCYGNGKGDFTITDLPYNLQSAPVFAFEKTSQNKAENQYLSGGNFFATIPYEGRYDAQPLALFSIQKNDSVNLIPQANLSSLGTEIRDIKWLRTAKGNVLVVAANNKSLLFYKRNQ